MSLTIGSKDVKDIRVGTTPVQSVHVGAVEVWRRAYAWEQVVMSKTITTPTWARYVDIVALGGGGGGTSGNGAISGGGNGGVAGSFATRCWPVTPGQSITFAIGQGGEGGSDGGDNAIGSNGGATTVSTLRYTLTLFAAGGHAGKGGGGDPGASPGSIAYTPTLGSVTDTTTQSGGGTASVKTDGQWPGGGGGPGSGGFFGNRTAGRPGAAGCAWYRFRAY